MFNLCFDEAHEANLFMFFTPATTYITKVRITLSLLVFQSNWQGRSLHLKILAIILVSKMTEL